MSDTSPIKKEASGIPPPTNLPPKPLRQMPEVFIAAQNSERDNAFASAFAMRPKERSTRGSRASIATTMINIMSPKSRTTGSASKAELDESTVFEDLDAPWKHIEVEGDGSIFASNPRGIEAMIKENSASELKGSFVIPTWFSLMAAPLSFEDDRLRFSGPTLGIYVDDSMMKGVAGFELRGTEPMSCLIPLMKVSQSMSDLHEYFKVKVNAGERLKAYSEYMSSPIISVDFGSKHSDTTLDMFENISHVSCEGLSMFKGSSVTKALEHYAKMNPVYQGVLDIWKGRQTGSDYIASSCMMTVPKEFWKSDNIGHIGGRVCMYMRAPGYTASTKVMVTPGYATMLWDEFQMDL
jgi:hypothetical protein